MTKKKTKLDPPGRWKEYVRFLMHSNPKKPLKSLLKNYKKEDYKRFCKEYKAKY